MHRSYNTKGLREWRPFHTNGSPEFLHHYIRSLPAPTASSSFFKSFTTAEGPGDLTGSPRACCAQRQAASPTQALPHALQLMAVSCLHWYSVLLQTRQASSPQAVICGGTILYDWDNHPGRNGPCNWGAFLEGRNRNLNSWFSRLDAKDSCCGCPASPRLRPSTRKWQEGPLNKTALRKGV